LEPTPNLAGLVIMTQRVSYGNYQAIFAKDPAKRTYAENLKVASSIRETAQLVLDKTALIARKDVDVS
jgi:hypothetical protein